MQKKSDMTYPTKKLGELFEITSSKRVFKSEWVDDGIPFYRAREVVSLSKGKEFKTPIFITNQMYEEYKDKYGVPKEGDLLATGVGTLGVCYRIKPDDKFYFKDGNIIWFKNISGVSPRYVELFFQSTNFMDQVKEYAGGATVKTFTIQTAKKIEIPFPPLTEQKKIVAKLEKLLAKVSEAKKLRAEAQESSSHLLPAELHKIFEEGKENGWEEKELGEICEIARGGSPRPIKDYLTTDEDGINWIKISDATQSTKYIYKTKQKIRKEGLHKTRLVKSGDFILTNSMSFGRPYIMRTEGAIHDGWLVLRPQEGLLEEYMYHFLSSDEIYYQFSQLAGGAVVQNLNSELVRSVKILMPPLPEQKKIVARLDSISEKVRHLQEHQKATSDDFLALEQSALSKAFSGEFV